MKDILRTYKTQDCSSNPTEVIDLHRYCAVSSEPSQKNKSFVFKLESRDRNIYFSSESETERGQWIGAISSTIIVPPGMRTKSEEDALNEFK